MRFYVSLLVALGMTVAACGKKTDPAKVDPKPATTEAKKEEPKKEEPKVEEAKKEAPADRTATLQKAFEAVSAGNFAEAFASFTDDATVTLTGVGDIKGKQAIIDAYTKNSVGWTGTKMKAARIVEQGEYQAVEYVWQATNSADLADGTKATNKTATARGASIMHFTADGKVDRMWEFVDMANVAMQIGAMPGLAADFIPATIPETTEVVKGEANAAAKDLYANLIAKFHPDTYEAAIKEVVADDFTMVDCMTGKTASGVAGATEGVKQWVTMFPDLAFTVDLEFSAGDFYVVATTATGTYKGGIPGVDAKDQKVTTHSVDFVKIAGGKIHSVGNYGNSLEMFAQLGLVAGAAAKPAGEAGAAVEAIGVVACDTYITGMTACIEKMPEAGRGAAKDAIAGAGAAGGDAAKSALETGCKQALDQTKQTMGALCPDVKWE